MFLTQHIFLFSYLFSIVMGRHLDFRERFLERKRLRSLKDQRITVLNNYALNNTDILDDITHYRKIKGRTSPAWKKIRAIEKDFRRLLAMKGMKYNYKRDMYWRTWRSIPPVNGATKELVSYKCNNLIHGNAKECLNCGMWTIEDRTPPCPFEFFSVLSDERLCGANYTQYKDVNNICPSIIKFSELIATCDNPIETQWQFTKMYGVTEKYDEVICKNKDFCEIFTLYEITPEHVIFRIINSTNDVIYSRIMKAKSRNYICVDDCGRFNPNTRKVAKADKPMKLDLLTVRKTKREDVPNEMNDSVRTTAVLNEMNNNHVPTIIKKREDAPNEINDSGRKTAVLNEMNDSVRKTDVLNEMNDKHVPTIIKEKEDVLDEMNDSVRKTDVLNEMNNKHVPTIIKQGEDVSNEINDNAPKREHVVSYEMNDGLHVSTEFTKTEEVSNDILPPMEENMSLSNFGRDEYVIVSIEKQRPLLDWDKSEKIMRIEENSLHKIKSRGMNERQQNNMNFVEKRFLLKPTVTTPCQKLEREADRTSYEDANLEMEY